MRWIIVSLALAMPALFAISFTPAANAQVSIGLHIGSPGPGYIWYDGYYGDGHVWYPGAWQLPPYAHARWHNGRWYHPGEHWARSGGNRGGHGGGGRGGRVQAAHGGGNHGGGRGAARPPR